MGFTNGTSSPTPIPSLQFATTLIQTNHYHEGLTNHSLFPSTTLTHMNLMNSSLSFTIPFNFNNEHEKKTGNEFVFSLAVIGSMPSTTAPFLNCSTYDIANYLSTLANGWYNICPFMHDESSNNDQPEPIMMYYLLQLAFGSQ